MKILFTKGQTTFSKTICAVTQEDISHVALQITLAGKEFVVHSNLLGLHLETYESFCKHSEILYILEKQDNQQEDTAKVLELLIKHEWSMYDLGAIGFLGFSLILRRYFKIPLPKSNLWQSTGMFMCVEWVSWFVDLKEESMCTPKRLYYILLGRPEWSSIYG
jgi:hypothetical protein